MYKIYALKRIYSVCIVSSVNRMSLIACPQRWEAAAEAQPRGSFSPVELSSVILGEAEQGSGPGREVRSGAVENSDPRATSYYIDINGMENYFE